MFEVVIKERAPIRDRSGDEGSPYSRRSLAKRLRFSGVEATPKRLTSPSLAETFPLQSVVVGVALLPLFTGFPTKGRVLDLRDSISKDGATHHSSLCKRWARARLPAASFAVKPSGQLCWGDAQQRAGKLVGGQW